MAVNTLFMPGCSRPIQFRRGALSMIVANSATDLIRKTPVVRINNLTGPDDATVYAKLEWFNIGGSVKDRLALYILEYAWSAGRLDKERTILEAMSGNTGIAL